MAQYAPKNSVGATCPWGSAWGSGPSGVTDAFTLAEMKAARKRGGEPAPASEAPAPVPGAVDEPGTARTEVSARSAVSRVSKASGKTQDLEAKMMNLITKCVEKKVEELTETMKTPVSSPASPERLRELRTSRSAESVRSARSAASSVVPSEAPSCAELKANLRAVEEPKAVTMVGKKKQAEKLSDASLGKFDAEESRRAFLEMQTSAAAARNKNRSALTFDDEPEKKPEKERKPEKKGYPALLKQVNSLAEAPEPLSMYGKQKRKEKLSEATLGKFDGDKSKAAYEDMQRTAELMRNKNRMGQGIF
ncbi:unnamed protein product [Effrenium voratum]|uniref:Uncharacterized protein n=1 Tax=Effrenium voratum TaxID=2562239 RepID=A0AA36ND56_9DINO|nr:unnamed protein product [Effrenium voratum]CAJ1438526.1 unnamed protein product [Effrenium voratum]